MPRSARRMSLLIVCLALAGSLGPDAPPKPDQSVDSYVDQEIAVCEEGMELLELAVLNAPTVRPDDLRFATWQERYIRAIGLSRMNKQAKIRALERLVERATVHERLAIQYHKAGQGLKGGVLDARYLRLDAEMALARTRSR
jgi:hypothetical protein